MNTRRIPTRRVEENDVHEESSPQVEQAPQGAQDDQVPIVEGSNDVPVVPPQLSSNDIRESLPDLA